MLATALDQHPDLKVAGEVLVRPERYGVFEDLDAEGQPCITMEDAWSKYNGFINQRDHTNPWVWNYVSGLSDVIFLSLKRHNILATLVSQKLADKTKAWQVQNRASTLMDATTDDWVVANYAPEFTVKVEYEEADAFIQKVKRLYGEIDQKVMHFRHPFLELYYEDLLTSWKHWMTITQFYLGVEPEPLLPSTVRQETRPLSAVIENYKWLRQKAQEADAEWFSMLEE
jgi:hypothetical protein